MENKRLIMLYELCRLCLENTGTVDMFETQDLVRDIYTCTAVKISKEANLPPKICTECYEVLHSLKNLKCIATKNDSYLQSLLGDDIEEGNEDNSNKTDVSNCTQISETKSPFFTTDDDHNIINRITSGNSYESRPGTPQIQVISVRKDIFEHSTTRNQSPKRKSPEDDYLPHLTPKTDQQVPRPIKIERFLNDLECDVCHKIFETQKKLYLHQRLHFKNILCPIDMCGKKFATKGDLEKHIRTHTGERPYQCEICDRSFAQKGTLKSHRDALHGGESYLLGK